MITISVCLIIALMAGWSSGQGLFSSLIHLVLTVLAACVAFALWEPIVYGFLIDRMPEYAWGVGLLLPFGLTLLIFRIAFDHLIPGNVSFHNVADRVGGGLFGAASGVLTTGLLVIGLQMSGVRTLFGYSGWDIGADDQPQKVASITPSVDSIAAGFFQRLSSGSMSSIASNATLATYHPKVDAEASLYLQDAFDDSRRSVTPAAVQLGTLNPATSAVELNTYCIVKTLPSTLADEKVTLGPNQKLVVIPVTVAVQNTDDAIGSGDSDGIYRITRGQIALATSNDPLQRSVQFTHPLGYIQLGQYAPLTVAGEYAYSRSGVAETNHHWIFRIPVEHDPVYLRVKGVRVLLPAKDNTVIKTDADIVAGLVTYKPTQVTLNPGDPGNPDGTQPGDPTGGPTKTVAESIRISDQLPWIFNRNQLGNLTLVADAIAGGHTRIRKPGRERIGPELAVKRIHHATGARIVQVDLGTREPRSLLGQIRSFAATVTQPPILKDTTGAVFFAIGYGIIREGEFEISIDPANAIRSIRQIDMGSLSDTDRVVLYYQIPETTKLTSFDLGNAQSQEIDIEVK